jgi:hypothetical protein
VRHGNQIILICPAAKRDQANAAALQLLGPGHEDTFSSPYNASGSGQPTHYVACGRMTDEFIATLLELADQFPTIKAVVSGPGDFAALSAKPNAKTRKQFHKPHDEIESEGLKPVVE